MTYNEFYHHGVKGMKWGVRRAEKKRLKVEENAKIYKRNYDAYVETVKKASLNKTLKEGDVVRGRHNVEVMLDKGNYVWSKSGDKLKDMSTTDLMDALYYLNYGEIPE